MDSLILWFQTFKDRRIAGERIVRFIFSLAEQNILMLLTLLVGLVTPSVQLDKIVIQISSQRRWLLVISGVMFILVRSILEYVRRTNDTTCALQQQAIFNQWKLHRTKAAKLLLNLLNSEIKLSSANATPSIDIVLGVLEDIGLDRSAGRISSEVAHHYFYLWIRGYYQLCKEYICEVREKESSAWEHIEQLFSITRQFERGSTPASESMEDKLRDFLRGEIALESGEDVASKQETSHLSEDQTCQEISTKP